MDIITYKIILNYTILYKKKEKTVDNKRSET